MNAPGEANRQAPPPQQTASGRRGRRPDSTRKFLVDLVLPILSGIIVAVGFYCLLVPLMPETVSAKLTERGFVPYLCSLLLFWHLSHVVIRYFVRIRPEFGVLREDLIPAGSNELSDEDLEKLSQRAIEMERRRRGNLLTRRILLAVAHLGIKRDTAELGDLLRRRAEADRHRTANAYAIPNFIFWAIPILGFVGTVLGIGIAVSKLSGSLGQVENIDALVAELGKVADGLGIAFDTTLVALLMSIPALLVQTLIRQQEARLLADVEDYLTYRLQSRIRSETAETVLLDLRRLQERMHREQTQAASMSLQTMMSSHDSLRDVLKQIPEMVSKTAESGAALLEGTREKLDGIAASIIEEVRKGLSEACSKLDDAAAHQLGMGVRISQRLEENAKRVSEEMAVGGKELREELVRLAKDVRTQTDLAAAHMAEALVASGGKAREDLEGLRKAFLEGVGREGQGVLAHAAASFRQAVAPLDEALKDVSEKLGGALREGQELLGLQAALRENLDQLSRIQKLGQTFEEVRDSLVSLRPVLEKLSRPIPVRLSLGGVELPDAGASAKRSPPRPEGA